MNKTKTPPSSLNFEFEDLSSEWTDPCVDDTVCVYEDPVGVPGHTPGQEALQPGIDSVGSRMAEIPEMLKSRIPARYICRQFWSYLQTNYVYLQFYYMTKII